MQILQDEGQDVTQMLETLLEGAADQLRAWHDEGSLPVLCMDISACVEELAIPLQRPEPLPIDPEAGAGDDGVLPNQQAIAQELLNRVLLMTGMPAMLLGMSSCSSRHSLASCTSSQRKLLLWDVGTCFVTILFGGHDFSIRCFHRLLSTALYSVLRRIVHILCLSGVAGQFQGRPDRFKLSCQKLSETFSDGLHFVVIMPAFQTLRQQTLDRTVKANFAEVTDAEVVIPTIWSSKAMQTAHHD